MSQTHSHWRKSKYFKSLPLDLFLKSAPSNIICIGMPANAFLQACNSSEIRVTSFGSLENYCRNLDQPKRADFFILFDPADSDILIHNPAILSSICQYAKCMVLPTTIEQPCRRIKFHASDFAEPESDGDSYWQWVTTKDSTARIDIDGRMPAEIPLELELTTILPSSLAEPSKRTDNLTLSIKYLQSDQELHIPIIHGKRIILPVPAHPTSLILSSNIKPLRTNGDTRLLSFGLMNPCLRQNKTEIIENPEAILLGKGLDTLEGIAKLMHELGYYFFETLQVGFQSGRTYHPSFSSTGSPGWGIHRLNAPSSRVSQEPTLHWIFASSFGMARPI